MTAQHARSTFRIWVVLGLLAFAAYVVMHWLKVPLEGAPLGLSGAALSRASYCAGWLNRHRRPAVESATPSITNGA